MTSKEIKKIIELVKENNQRNNAEIVSFLLALEIKLESLEALEKENEKLKMYPPEFDGFLYSFEGLFERNKKLEEENQELKMSNKEIEELYLNENKHWCETIDNLRTKNEKLKKVIEILKEKAFLLEFGLEVFEWDEFYKLYTYEHNWADYDCEGDLEYHTITFTLTQQEYELLKEAEK